MDPARPLDRSTRNALRRAAKSIARQGARQIPNTSREPCTALSIVLSGDEPPNEFRIFTAGTVDTVKGQFVFDAAAAESVMAEYQAHGIDLMLDYDHASLGVGLDPALSGKAAGWFNLEVRNGELWAVNVRWTPPAAEALRRKEWRFMSPAFQTDGDRIVSVMNVAVTNLPATRNLDPLMAASAVVTLGETAMLDAATVKKALDALAGGDAEACMGILTEMIAAAASGEAPAEPAAELAETPAAEEPEKEKPEEVMAATSRLTRITGKDTIVSAIAEVEVWRQSHLKLETETQKLAHERSVLETAERRRLCISLVTEAGQAPALVWASSDVGAPPAPHFAAMTLEHLRSYVGSAIATSIGKAKIPAPPGGGKGADGSLVLVLADRTVTLSARELAMCAEMKIDPKEYAARKPAKKD